MASALKGLSNATATFHVATTGVLTDPDTGNITAAMEEVTATFYLKSDRIADNQFPGVSVQQIIYDGYAIEPLDSRLTVGSTGVLTFAGEDVVNVEITGLRLPYGKTGLLGEVLNASLGERIQLATREQLA